MPCYKPPLYPVLRLYGMTRGVVSPSPLAGEGGRSPDEGSSRVVSQRYNKQREWKMLIFISMTTPYRKQKRSHPELDSGSSTLVVGVTRDCVRGRFQIKFAMTPLSTNRDFLSIVILSRLRSVSQLLFVALFSFYSPPLSTSVFKFYA